jgi:hypothetical protein
MKILFLDIDGVLNSRRSLTAFGEYPINFSARELAFFDWVAVALVRRLCRETKSKVVLSSTWRYFFSAEQVAAALDLPVIDCTPKSSEEADYARRGGEIEAWLDDHPEVTHYAITDDINAMLDEQQPHFVQTDERCGLSLNDYHLLYMILTDPDLAIRAI